MKITFVSNYINHHQIPLSDTLYHELEENYHFIQTQPMEEERVQMGWKEENGELPYLRLLYREEAECKALIADSDVVIFGWAEESLIADRLDAGKPVIRCSERIYREGQWRAISPRGLKQKYHDHTRHRNKPVYLLCAGAYVPSDFQIIRAYKNKMFRWGYFTESKEYDIESLLENKGANSDCTEILWTGRLIPLKHAELLISLAITLRNRGNQFHITIIGDGEEKEQLQNRIEQEKLTEFLTMTGFQKPEEVRKYMEKAHIFLATSDYREGWGAVVNEAMNSGCAVVASHAMGAVPFLIKHEENGLIFKSQDVEDLCKKVCTLIETPAKREELGRRAYETIVKEWNGRTAGKRLIQLCEGLLTGKTVRFEKGPCSPAPIIPPYKMYREITK